MKILTYIALIPIIVMALCMYFFMLVGAGISFLLSSAFHSLVTIIEEINTK